MPTIKVYIHFVWSTKDRVPFLHSPELRKQVWVHIKDNARKKEIFIDTINGHQDHCHCLVSLGKEQSMSRVMHLIKGESSFWINKGKLIDQKFEWQDEYFALSVSESQLERVRLHSKSGGSSHPQIIQGGV